MKKETGCILLLLAGFITSYLFGWIFPDYWWSTHFISFISPIFQFGIFLGIIGFLIKIFHSNSIKNLEKYIPRIHIKSVAIIAVIFMVLSLIFPMIHDFYGDSYKFTQFLDKVPPSIPEGTHEKLFSYNLTPWAGEGTILALITYIAYYFQITYKTSFLIFDAAFGGLFIFIWLHCIHRFILTNIWKIILGLAGISAPFVLIFFGHIEIYAPILCVNLLWIYLALLYIRTEKQYLLWLLPIVLLISLKLHAIAVLCIPALLLLFWKRLKSNYPNWKQISLFILTPIFIIGSILYFFIFEDHIDDRSLQQKAMAYEHIFLPLFSPEPPLDNYNLLGFAHFFDFFSLLFMWSPIALLLLGLFVGVKQHKIQWNAPEVLISGLCLLLFVSFFFVINPLLGLPMDWDLFCIPAPFLLIFVMVLTSQLEQEFSPPKIFYASMIIVLLNIPVFIVHRSEKSLSLRLESVAIYMYGSYYEWTAKIADHAFSIGDPHHINRLQRGEKFLEKLGPKAEKIIDYEYAALLIDQGRYFLRIRNKPDVALAHFSLAEQYNISNNAKLLALEAHFMSEQYADAFQVSKKLVQLQFPNPEKALKISLHAALEAGFYKEAFDISQMYLNNWPDNSIIRTVNQRLYANDRIEELKLMFHNVNRQ